MDYWEIRSLRDRHAAWRLLRAGNSALILSFLGTYFLEHNRGSSPAGEVTDALDEHLYELNMSPGQDDVEPTYPKSPAEYLSDWSEPGAGFLRRFYPVDRDEVHYEVTPAFETAYSWVESLKGRSFVGTESRLHTVVDLLRQIVHGVEEDQEARLTELTRQRDDLDKQIELARKGELPVLDETGVRDRYQQVSDTARGLLRDFREVEDNFRNLDRAAREKIAAWGGSKGELLSELVESRTDISSSDQGRSFQAFYDFLLSESRQVELAQLLQRASDLDSVDPDLRLRTIHYDWSEAAERAQRTVRQISEQLRRFLDERVWLENRRVLELLRSVESTALTIRDSPPSFGITMEDPSLPMSLPFERPLYQPPASSIVDSSIAPVVEESLDADVLFAQTFVDPARLQENIRAVLPTGSSALLSDIVNLYPLEQGAAEIIGYLGLSSDELETHTDETQEMVIDYADPSDPDSRKRVRLPRITVFRR